MEASGTTGMTSSRTVALMRPSTLTTCSGLSSDGFADIGLTQADFERARANGEHGRRQQTDRHAQEKRDAHAECAFDVVAATQLRDAVGDDVEADAAAADADPSRAAVEKPGLNKNCSSLNSGMAAASARRVADWRPPRRRRRAMSMPPPSSSTVIVALDLPGADGDLHRSHRRLPRGQRTAGDSRPCATALRTRWMSGSLSASRTTLSSATSPPAT